MPGVPVGSDTSRAYRVRPDRSVLRLPGKVVRARPGTVRLRLRVTTAPGSETYVAGSVVPQGRVRVRVGRTTVTRRVGAGGWATVVLRKQRPGREVVHVRHLGTRYVTPAAPRRLRLVVRRGH